MSQLVFSIFMSPGEVGSNASEGMDFLWRQEQPGKEQELPSSVSLNRLPAESMAQIRDGFSQLKRSGLKVCLLTSKIQIRSRYSLSN